MNAAASLLLLFNFSLIGLLPLLFFRRDGSFNLLWLLTALPFLIAALLVLAGWLEWVTPWLENGSPLSGMMTLAAVAFSATSIGLLGMTVGAHRIPLALWHQNNDAAVELVTWGPYASIRHPFYSSFLLSFLATALALPHAGTIGVLAYAVVALTLTAKKEERRLLASRFATHYQAYMRRTGRFLPSWQTR